MQTTISKPFESQFLDGDMKAKIDKCTKADFNEVRNALIEYVRTNFKNPDKHVKNILKKTDVFSLQKFYYDYILVSTGNKVV